MYPVQHIICRYNSCFDMFQGQKVTFSSWENGSYQLSTSLAHLFTRQVTPMHCFLRIKSEKITKKQLVSYHRGDSIDIKQLALVLSKFGL